MEILRNEILPLFENIQPKDKIFQTNKLINIGINRYELYVDLKDIYLNKSQTHLIDIYDKRLEYTIPLHYHEIILQGKGYHHQDIQIDIYSKRCSNYIRVNSNDLLYIKKLSLNEWINDTYTFKHFDTEDITINLRSPKLHKILNKGLPKSNNTRGHLYILIDLNLDPSDLIITHNTNTINTTTDTTNVTDNTNDSTDSTDTADFSFNEKYNQREDIELEYLLEILNYHPNSNVYYESTNIE